MEELLEEIRECAMLACFEFFALRGHYPVNQRLQVRFNSLLFGTAEVVSWDRGRVASRPPDTLEPSMINTWYELGTWYVCWYDAC